MEQLKLLPDNSIHMVCTSPPYYSARFYGKEDNCLWDVTDPNCQHEWIDCGESKVSYLPMSDKSIDNKSKLEGHVQQLCKKCGAFYGQLGQEPTPKLFIKHLADIFDEVKRVLHPMGLLFLNLGDTYCGSGGGFADKIPNPKSRQSKFNGYFASSVIAPPSLTCIGSERYLVPKQLMLIPSRLAIEMQDRGWILRQDIIWKKLSGLPNSGVDRFDSKYEHIFMFAKSPYYFFDTNNARKPYAPTTVKRKNYVQSAFGGDGLFKSGSVKGNAEPTFVASNEKGAVKTDVWEIHTANTKIKHFAAFSSELVENCIKPGCAKEVCSVCGNPKIEKRKTIVRNIEELPESDLKIIAKIDAMDVSDFLKEKMKLKVRKKKISIGFIPTCKCNAEFVNGIVLDPFAGTGTTLLTAKQLGYRYVGIEMQPEYYKIIIERLKSML